MELLLAAATLLGGVAAIWFFKDKLFPSGDKPATSDDLVQLERKVADLLTLRPQHANPERGPSPPAPVATESDTLTLRIAALLVARQQVVQLMQQLAQLRDISLSGKDPSLLQKELRLPKPVDDAITQVLSFTDNIQQHSLVDVRFSAWATDMAESSAQFLRMLIANSKQRAE